MSFRVPITAEQLKAHRVIISMHAERERIAFSKRCEWCLSPDRVVHGSGAWVFPRSVKVIL